MVVVLGLVTGACGADDPVAVAPDTRPPLGDPPDPGPVPDQDGFTDSQRAEIVAATVRITGSACGIQVDGSGFAVGPDLIATVAHVLVGMEDPRVETVATVDLGATTVAFDPENDLALLRVPGADLEPFDLGDAADRSVGVLIGWENAGEPDPVPYRIDRPVTVRIDRVAADGRVERPSWLVAADVDSGDSGAALVDQSGVVVGIAYATTRRDAGVAYATRASELQRLLDTSDLASEVELPPCA
jgi:hypothetical protein